MKMGIGMKLGIIKRLWIFSGMIIALHLTALFSYSDECVSPYAVEPRAEDVYMLELINRARSDPDAEAARYGIDLNEGVPAWKTITNDPKPPLAFNLTLHKAALAHSNDMLTYDYFDHYTLSDGSSPQDRAIAQGYNYYSRENIAINMVYPGPMNIDQEIANTQHQGLFVDEGIQDRGHRVNMLHDTIAEAGIAFAHGDIVYESTYYSHAVTSTTDFGRGETPPYICGVVYDDLDRDAFYDVGEGISNVTLTIQETGTVVYGFSAGAYAIPVASPGSFTLEARICNSDAQAVKIVQVGSENVKVDFLLTDFHGEDGEPPVVEPPVEEPPVVYPSDCAHLTVNELILPQTDTEIAMSPVRLSSPSSFFFKSNDLSIAADIPCYTQTVDIYMALYTVNGDLYFVLEDGSLSRMFEPLATGLTTGVKANFSYGDVLNSLYGVYWLIVPTNGGNAATIDFNGYLQLGFMDATRLW